MAADSRDKLLVRENLLGWRLYRREPEYLIVCPNPLWRRCLVLLMPAATALPLYLVLGSFLWWVILPLLPMGLLISQTMRFRIETQGNVTKINGLQFDLTSVIPIIHERKGRVFLRVSTKPRRSRYVSSKYLLWESFERSEVEWVLGELLGATLIEEPCHAEDPDRSYFTVNWRGKIADAPQ